jgi:hypothetical protein
MKTYPISNISNVSQIISELFSDDITYLINNSRFVWGDYSDNLLEKIKQYDLMPSFPVFGTLLTNGFFVSTAFLEYVRPTYVKSIYNMSIKTGKPNATNIIMPLRVSNSVSPSYQMYNQDQLSQFTKVSDGVYVSEIITETGSELVEYEVDMVQDTPLIINSPGVWSGMLNRSNDDLVTLRLTLGGDPDFNSIVSLFNH